MTDNVMLGAWRSIETAPHDGTVVDLGWLPNWPTLEHSAVSRWSNGHWVGWFTPTHWRKASNYKLQINPNKQLKFLSQNV